MIEMATVTITQGKLKGGEVTTESGFKYFEFLGIPYAKPPVGDLRFKSPQPAEAWKNERDATASAYDIKNTAIQVGFFTGEITGSEDCLYLNVYTPKIPISTSESLPVMVYIHGGGFVIGSGTNRKESGPDFLIENDVVIVTINYRLGVFGFLSLGIPEAAGNMGLKDQVKGLEWVQNNIKHFGGDKNNVTVFGMSAGSASLEYLMLSPMAKGLFHKSILQSGSSLNGWAINYEPKKLIDNLLSELDYRGSLNDNKDIYEYLLNIPAATLTGAAFKVAEKYTEEKIFFGFVPTIEKDFGNEHAFLTQCPYKLLKEGNFNYIPIIRGFCKHEGSLVTGMKPLAVKGLLDNKSFADYWVHILEPNDRSDFNEKLQNLYIDCQKQEDNEWVVDFFGDKDFIAGIWISGQIMADTGIPIHMYKFSYAGNINSSKLLFGMMKNYVGHGDDLTYILQHDAISSTAKATEIDKLVRSRITKMWTNFAKFGDPTPDDCSELSIKWPKFTRTLPVYLNIDKEFSIENNYEPKKMALFEQIYEKYEK